MRFLVIASAVLFSSQVLLGQVDVSSELLLRPSSADNYVQAPGLDSGRYKVTKPVKPASATETNTAKKIKSLPGKKVSGSETTPQADASKSVVVPPTTSTSTTTTTLKTVKSEQKKVEKLLFTDPEPIKAEIPEPKAQVEEPVFEEPTVSDQVRDIVFGNGPVGVEEYKEQIHHDDIRLNQIEVNILPGVVSTTSKSSYSYRNYSTFAPKVSLGANFWLTPFLGVYGDYTTTMGGDVIEDSSINSRTTAQQEWTEIGFDVRKFFGMSRKSNSLEFGLFLSEYKFKVRGDSSHRVQLRSSGVGAHLTTRIPVAPSYSWTFGGKLIPRLQHAEMETGINLSSGSGGESSRVDLMLGGEFKLARQNQIIWDITTSFEKNQFNGQANMVDPETGVAPRGVSVENTFVIFSLGYRWGQ